MELCQKILIPHAPPFQVIRTDTDQAATYDFLPVFRSNYGAP